MRIVIATVQVPFVHGGAESHASGLLSALRAAGHQAEVVTMPFRFHPVSEIVRAMDVWQTERFEQINGYQVDRVIALKFPALYLQHPTKVAWLLHQHRPVYDLWDTRYGADLRALPEGVELKRAITERDTMALRSCKRVFTTARQVSRRLQQYNGLPSEPLYHPPPLAERIFTAGVEPYVFFPSRLEELKRQSLLVEAMRHTRTPIVALIAGDGGFRDQLEGLVRQYDLSQRVRLLGRITEDEMLAYYAHSLGVFFGPFEEDYGYVTLEAMLAEKPVVTCTDSGGPLEFVVPGETGLVVAPEPKAIAEALDQLYLDKRRSIAMGRAGAERYRSLGISWSRVREELLS